MWDLIADISSATGILVALLCYVSGLGSVLMALMMWLKKARSHGGQAPSVFAIVGTAFIGATLLSFTNFANILSATIGSSAHVSVGSPTQLRAQEPDLTNLPTQDLATLVSAFLTPLRAYFYVYGLLFLYIAIMKLRDRLNGDGHAHVAGCVIGACGSLCIMNMDVIVPWFITKMKL